MTRRELAFSAMALAVGLVVGALLARRSAPGASVPRSAPRDAAVFVEEAPKPSAPFDDDAAAPDVPMGASTHVPGGGQGLSMDAAKPEGGAVVVRAANLLIHPSGDERACVDAPSHAHGLQLYRCHGQANQRWTFAEDLSGASRIFGSAGGCMRVGESPAGGEVPIELGACGADTPRFRHLEDRRLQEVHSGQCVTVRGVANHSRLVLEPCDPSNGGQGWTFAP